MAKWEPTQEYRKIVEANRCFYAATAAVYDGTETCVASRRLQAELEAELDAVIAALGRPPEALRALDACGGSGNVALKLARRGVQVTLVDVSTDLQRLFRDKCAAAGVEAQVVERGIGAFLTETDQRFDIIVFSSALHHLENIGLVLERAFCRLVPGGLLFTIFDPTLRRECSRATRVLQRAEYYLFKIACQTPDLGRALRRRIGRGLSGVSAEDKARVPLRDDTAGVLAEYHVERGVDDRALVSTAEALGYRVLRHERYADSRFALTRWVIARLGDITAFKLLLQRPAEAENGTSEATCTRSDFGCT